MEWEKFNPKEIKSIAEKAYKEGNLTVKYFIIFYIKNHLTNTYFGV
ncbi:hypothetical protein DESAMIL20_410 [Desulfurella amilsii]|uniref:Uncharacterized protein n=1 Tax=Desulfurella amilsii TaxID=1562698 RepID=A0A1X4XZ07_9BACT|nr:hypothetical protein [Desulfurella amilsii]OSS42766.1 hypothetical protein DESAMIL20_410 [Desulfurella amilsii]